MPFSEVGCSALSHCGHSRCALPALSWVYNRQNRGICQLEQVPMKPTLLATLKSNNYLLNCLLAMSAQDHVSSAGLEGLKGCRQSACLTQPRDGLPR